MSRSLRSPIVSLFKNPERRIADALASGGLVPVASGRGHDGAITIRQADATLWVGRLEPGTSVDLPEAPWVHAYVARGAVDLGEHHLDVGDSARLTDAPASTVTAIGPTELVVWESHSHRP